MAWQAPQPFEIVEHTADSGVRVHGTTREEALARLVLGHAQILTGGRVPAGERHARIEVPASGDAALVGVDALRQMNLLFCTERVVARAVTGIDWSAARVCLDVVLGDYDPAEHNEGVDIKAITYHAALFEPDGDGWVAQVIVDV